MIEFITYQHLMGTRVTEKKITTIDYQNLFDNHPMARFILTVMPDHTYTLANSNHTANLTFALPKNDIIGAPITQFFTSNTADNLNSACTQCVTTKRPITIETTPLYPNAIERQFFILNPVFNDTGNVYLIDMIAVAQNKEINQLKVERDDAIRRVGEQKNAKDEADGANQAKSAFLTNMSHELRTPLNAIIGFSEVIRDEIFGPIANDKYKEYLTDIHFSAQHLLEIINDVLDMSKIEAGKFVLVENDIDLPALFTSVKRIIAERAQAKGIIFITDLDEHIPNIHADKRVMRQILLNLLSNAIKFSTAGDTVTLSAHITPTGAMDIVVKDTGYGIAQDNINRVLEPFNQAYDPLISNGQNGTGLGLSLTKAMAQLHGGTLTIHSKLGEGTTVSVQLPETRILSMNDDIKEIAQQKNCFSSIFTVICAQEGEL